MGDWENLGPDLLTQMFRTMARLKTNDDKMAALMKAGRISMPFYSWRGQEAIPTGTFAALRPDDYLCTIYRGLHDAIAKGIPLDRLWAELLGRSDGTCKGKGGPMHITHPEKGIMLTTGIVGSSMPIATGLGFASQVKGDARVTVAMFGDGASNIGAFHESLNLAAVWKLPIIFMCQNNGYAEHTRFSKCTSVANVADRAVAYSIPGVTVDGNDPVAVYRAVQVAADRARAGEGPTLIEGMTFRYRGHVFGDDQAYMEEGEKDAWMARDPFPRFRARLLDLGVASDGVLAEIEREAVAEVEAAVEFAMASPPVSLDELETDVFGVAT